MALYNKTLSGAHALDKLQEAIRFEEKLACQFINSQVAAVGTTITNKLTFQEVDAIPPDIQLLTHGGAAPDGSTLVWSGVMLVGGSNAVVDIWRSPAA